jgi:xylulokinase
VTVAELVIGVDSSTQSTKVQVHDSATGALVGTGRAAHPSTTPPVSEQDPGAWWSALAEAIGQLGDLRADVAAIAVAAQQHGMVVTDRAGAVLRPAKLWNDTTSAPQAEALVATHGADWWARRCGSVPVAAFTVTKLAWLIEHEPATAASIARVMLPHDYLTWRLTGNHVTDRGDASGTGWWSHSGYVQEILDLVGLAEGAMPVVLGPREPAGTITPTVAAELGLPETVVVGPGTGDNMAAALGLALVSGDVAVSVGTSGTVYAVADAPTADPTGAVAGFADATGRFLPLVCTLNATKVTDAVAHWLGTDAAGLADLALAAGPAASGVVLVPYFDGERTPNLPDATGRLTGLRTDTTREELALAAHDGVVCGLLDGLDALGGAGVGTAGRIHLVGGGARSGAYRQRLADLAERPVVVPESVETVALGAAVQAAAVLTGREPQDVAAAWGLGTGTVVRPRDGVNAAERRAMYAVAARCPPEL